MKQAVTVGILFPGEMGASIGRLLHSRGIRVVSTLEGRSKRTAQLCYAAGLTVLDSVGEVVSHSDVIISTVPPGAAISVAQRVAAEFRPGRRPAVYVDANSISPVTMRHLGSVILRPNFTLVDAAIHGVAARLSHDATMYLSGSSASEVAAMVGTPPRLVLLGDEVGRASLFKMLLGGTSKGTVALMIELSDLASSNGILDEFWTESRRWYPGIMDLYQRLLPTYPQHVGRRIQEMGELELTLSNARREPIMAAAVRNLFSRAAGSPATLLALVERMSRQPADNTGPPTAFDDST